MGHFNKFNRDRGGDNFGGRGDRQMFSAVCGKCGQRCEVPFRPSGDRQVFCNECFRAQRDAGQKFVPKNVGGANAAGVSKGQLDALNAKLDKILAILAPAKAGQAKSEPLAKEEANKIAAVKPAKKAKVPVKKSKSKGK